MPGPMLSQCHRYEALCEKHHHNACGWAWIVRVMVTQCHSQLLYSICGGIGGRLCALQPGQHTSLDDDFFSKCLDQRQAGGNLQPVLDIPKVSAKGVRDEDKGALPSQNVKSKLGMPHEPACEA